MNAGADGRHGGRKEEGEGRNQAESGGISPHFCCFWPHLHTQLRGWNRNGPEWSGMVRNGVGNVMELDWEKRGAVLMETMEFDR